MADTCRRRAQLLSAAGLRPRQAFFGILKTQPSLPDGTRELPAAGASAFRAPKAFPHLGVPEAPAASTSGS